MTVHSRWQIFSLVVVSSAVGWQLAVIFHAHGWFPDSVIENYSGWGAWAWLAWLCLLTAIPVIIGPRKPKE